MELRIDARSATSPYEQLRHQIEGLIGSGGLAAGDRLPTVRQLAADLGVAPGTVARAYRELEQRGLLEGRGRAGSFVADDDAHHAAQAAAHAYVARIESLGLPASSALTYVERLVAPSA
ncbi:GntR family transcriptional regulator [Janibacter sp. GS2]|uniref:GntR family transcriptional regulator n=1 Tax=Janibacter sp. GS2 TaxID=3442646 RepID=UPI003EBCC377